MSKSTLYIKNMVCDRCIRVVAEELEKLGYNVPDVRLGEADITTDNPNPDMQAIRDMLEANGFELLDDRRTKLVEQIKIAVIALVYDTQQQDMHLNTSAYISQKVGVDYTYLSTLFSATEGLTIERYAILQRIERTKELLVYNELSLKEIAYQLSYSSVAHLSGQFKKITGLTPSHFKQLKAQKRKTIDKVQE